jgi:hypothetical protein
VNISFNTRWNIIIDGWKLFDMVRRKGFFEIRKSGKRETILEPKTFTYVGTHSLISKNTRLARFVGIAYFRG